MNNNLISVGALILSVFFAGMYIRGEWSRSADLKNQLQEMKDLQAQTKAQVDSINAAYNRDKLEILEKTRQFYLDLDTVIGLKLANTRAVRAVDLQLAQQEQELAVQIRLIEELAKRQKVQLDTGQ